MGSFSSSSAIFFTAVHQAEHHGHEQQGGYRLGYGGGFYDRTLQALQPQPFTVGLGFADGFVPDFEAQAHDVPLQAILNDHGVVWPVPDFR